MKYARKEFIKEKKSKKNLKLGLIVLIIIALPLTTSVLNRTKLRLYIKNIFIKEIIKPVGNPSKREALVNLLAEKNIKINNIKFINDRIEIKIIDGPLVIIKNTDIEKQVTSLQWIVERFKIEGRQVNVIDLRFSKVVIK